MFSILNMAIAGEEDEANSNKSNLLELSLPIIDEENDANNEDTIPRPGFDSIPRFTDAEGEDQPVLFQADGDDNERSSSKKRKISGSWLKRSGSIQDKVVEGLQDVDTSQHS